MWHSRAQGCAGTGRGGDAKVCVCVWLHMGLCDCDTVWLCDCVT